MTARDWCEAMLLPYEHPESDAWTEEDRDAFLRWRLSSYAEWARRQERTPHMADFLRRGVAAILHERTHLYHPRYKACTCRRCQTPVPRNTRFEAWMAEWTPTHKRRIA